jgi:hypothetical protein
LVLWAALQGAGEPGRGVAEVFRAGEEISWAIEKDGERLGECASRYEGEVLLGERRAHWFRDRVRLRLTAELEQRSTVDLWTDERGRPLSFQLRSRLGDVEGSAEGVFRGGAVELVVRQGAGEKTLAVAVPEGAYLLANNFLSHLDLALALAPDGPSQFFSATVLQPFPYSLRRVDVPGEPLVYDDSLGERLFLSAERRLQRVELRSQGIEMRRVDEPVARFTLDPPRLAVRPDFEREEVRIVDGDVSLAGTITRPKGARGRLPALTFLSGSGPQDRDGVVSGLDLGTREILDHLTLAGFLVLRFDDRGVGASTGPTDGIEFADLVEDGRRAVRFLLARPDVDPERVALLGHSEGGLSAPVLAAEEPIAALVLLAAPGRPLEELLGEQLLAARRRAGASEEALAAFEAELARSLAALAAEEPLEARDLLPELAPFLPARAWLASHLGRDPLPFLRRVRCPVLILQGGRDAQVSAERDAPALLRALAEAGHGDHELRVFPALDHLFKVASEPPSELDILRARPVDPAFLAALAAWLAERLRP